MALTYKHFESDQDIRWCPGCGDYSILRQTKQVLAELNIPKQDLVFISGIGCSSRFPYYIDSYGMHSIHGRAPAFATGLKCANPSLSIWVITGDGDGLSIGANHLAHTFRRNVDLNVLLFNNQIYGLTKGQYSPTSPVDSLTKSTPYGSLDQPFTSTAFATGTGATFIARSADRDPKHLQTILKKAEAHRGTALVEIYQNCNVFNDGAFDSYTDKKQKQDFIVYLEHDKPLTFGSDSQKAIILDGHQPRVLENYSEAGYSLTELWQHDEHDFFKANILANFSSLNGFPHPFGLLYQVDRPTYDQLINEQVREVLEKKGAGDLQALIAGEQAWEVS